MRHDPLTLIEWGGYAPPVAFECESLLLDWASRHGLDCQGRVGSAQPGSAILVSGRFRRAGWPPGKALAYRQVWARAGYGGFREALLAHMRPFVGEDAAFGTIDADHVVNRRRLEAFPAAWINIFPVWGPANQGFGWIERGLPKPQPGFRDIRLNGLTAFKLLRENSRIRTVAELDAAIDAAAARILPEDSFACAFGESLRQETAEAYRGWRARRLRIRRPAPG